MANNNTVLGAENDEGKFLIHRKQPDAERKSRSGESDLVASMGNLVHQFPNLLVGQSLWDQVKPGTKPWLEFIAMAIAIDRKTSGSDSHPEEDIAIEAARILNTEVSKMKGLWGLLDHGVFGCYLSGMDLASAQDWANTIRAAISDTGMGSVSIGIAGFPMAFFREHQILENARKALDHAAFFGPNTTIVFDAVSLNISGDKLYQKGDLQAAIREYEDGLALEPLNVNLLNSLGVCYGALNDYDNALKAFNKVTDIDPNEPMAAYNIGLIYSFMGNQDKALQWMLRAYTVNDSYFEIVFQVGKLYCEMGRHDQAKSFFEKATQLKPESAIAYRYLGDCLVELDNKQDAIAAYKKAIKYNPYDATSLSTLGYLFDLLGENPEISTVFCRHSVDMEPDNGLFRYRLGLLYMKQNRLEEAMNQFIQANRLGYNTTQDIEHIQTRLSYEYGDLN